MRVEFTHLEILILTFPLVQAVSVDCPNLIDFARGLRMHIASSSIWNSLQSDCCTATGVTCSGSRVDKISWTNLGLNGFLNGTAMPVAMTDIDVSGNQLTGNVPSILPAGLIYFRVEGNRMSGDLPQSFPSTLQNLKLGYPGMPGNHFSGTLYLYQPHQLRINDNWITDLIIQDSSQINPSYCDLSNNPLLGNPNVAALTMCTKTLLYSPTLLPNTKSTAQMVSAQLSILTMSQFKTSIITIPAWTSIVRTINSRFDTSNAVISDKSLDEQFITAFSAMNSTEAVPNAQVARRTLEFSLNLPIFFRLVVSAMILANVVGKTPFRREFKRMLKGKKKETTTGNFK